MSYKTKNLLFKLVILEVVGIIAFYYFNWVGLILLLAGICYYGWAKHNKKDLFWFLSKSKTEESPIRTYTKDEILSKMLKQEIFEKPEDIIQANVFYNNYSTDFVVKKNTYLSSLDEYLTYSKNNGLIEKDEDLEFQLRREYNENSKYILNNRNFASVWYSVNHMIETYTKIKLLHNLISTHKLSNREQFANYVFENCFKESEEGYILKENQKELYRATQYLDYLYFESNCNAVLFKLIDYRNKLLEFYRYFEEVKKYYWVIKSGLEGEQVAQSYIKNITKFALYNVAVKIGNKTTENDIIIFTRKGIFTLEVKNYGNGDLIIDKNENISFIKNGEDVLKEKNPISQNKHHVSMLNKLLNEKVSPDKINWVIVLPNPKVIIKNESNLPILSMPYLPSYINNLPDVLSFEEAKWAYQKIIENSVESPKYERPIMTQNLLNIWYGVNPERSENEKWDDEYNKTLSYLYDNGDYDEDY